MNMDNSTLQRLMTKAYEGYTANMSQDEFWETLKGNDRIAVFTGNLNSQVENGGFHQWCDNLYSSCHVELAQILRTINTPTTLRVAEMVAKAGYAYDTFLKEEKSSGSYYNICDCDEDDGCSCYEDDPSDGLRWSLDGLDDEFYKINQQLLEDVEAYVNGKPNPAASEPTKAPETGNNPLYEVNVKLLSGDGNAMSIVASVTYALRAAKVSREKIEEFAKEALSGDYDKVLQTAMRWVHVS